MRPIPQHPHRRIAASSHSTTDNQPNRSTYPETRPVDTDDRAHYPDARITMRQPPYAGTHRGQQGPRAAPPPPPQHKARITLICPLPHRPTPPQRGLHSANPSTTTTHTHSPHPKTATQANLTPPGQAVHLQSMRPSYSFAQGGSRSNRGWPGHRHPKTATPQTVSQRHRSAGSPRNLSNTSPLRHPSRPASLAN